jgi:hypothetical protein
LISPERAGIIYRTAAIDPIGERNEKNGPISTEFPNIILQYYFYRHASYLAARVFLTALLSYPLDIPVR